MLLLLTATTIGLAALCGWLVYRLRRHRPTSERVLSKAVLLEAYKSFPHVAVVTRMRDGVVVDVNEAFEQSTGYSRAEAIGTTTLRFYEQPERRARLVELMTRHGRVRDFEFRAVTKSGEVRHCQAHARRIALNGKAHVFSVVQDVTELRELQREVLRYADDERRKLANELHDGLAQDLAGVSYLMRSIEQTLESRPFSQLEQLRDLRDVIEKAIDKARAIAHGFSPIEMSQGGLSVALYRLRLDVATIYRIDVGVDLQSSIQLDEAASVGIYTIVHEAVHNAARHSGCSKIDVQLTAYNGELEIDIRDDGNGIVESNTTLGMGIRLMRHRAAALGGHLQIDSAPGEGTNVKCRFEIGTDSGGQGSTLDL